MVLPTATLSKSMPYKDPQKQKACARKYYADNLERSKEQMRQRRRANPDYMRQWAAANPRYNEQWRRENPERYLEAQLRRLYGITLKEFKRLNEMQKGLCKLCSGLPTGKMKRLCVDHDHKTGKVRGLLCRACNSLLGNAKDNPEILKKTIAYLASTC